VLNEHLNSLKLNIFMNTLKLYGVLILGLIGLLLTSCGKDPIKNGASVTLLNTLETQAVAGYDTETNFGDAATEEVSDDIEFPAFLGIYNIDVSDSQIEFSMSAEGIANEFISGLFRTLEADTYDRYYFTFDDEQRFESATSNNEFVNVSVTNGTMIKVEIGEGFEFGADTIFTVTLEK